MLFVMLFFFFFFSSRRRHTRFDCDWSSDVCSSDLLFLNLGLQIVRSGGWLGLVLPDPLLARTNAASERTRLLKEFTIHHLWHLSDVFTAQVGAVVIIAQKSPPRSQHQVAWKREKWKHITAAASNAQP